MSKGSSGKGGVNEKGNRICNREIPHHGTPWNVSWVSSHTTQTTSATI